MELIGLFAFATSGALLAIRRDFDAIGIGVLAIITAIGGGVLRDLLIGDIPPAAFLHWEYLAVPIAAAAVTFFAHQAIERRARALLLFDAAGLGLYCVTGTVKALDYGMGVLQAAALGFTTAVGGGILRDVIARETPVIVRPDTELYAVPAILGALTVAVVWEVEAYFPAVGAGVAAGVFGFRLLALRSGWRGPRARGAHGPGT